MGVWHLKVAVFFSFKESTCIWIKALWLMPWYRPGVLIIGYIYIFIESTIGNNRANSKIEMEQFSALLCKSQLYSMNIFVKCYLHGLNNIFYMIDCCRLLCYLCKLTFKKERQLILIQIDLINLIGNASIYKYSLDHKLLGIQKKLRKIQFHSTCVFWKCNPLRLFIKRQTLNIDILACPAPIWTVLSTKTSGECVC